MGTRHAGAAAGGGKRSRRSGDACTRKWRIWPAAPPSRATQISESEASHRGAAARRDTKPGESLLQLHGEQKQAEEALVHQTESLRKNGDARITHCWNLRYVCATTPSARRRSLQTCHRATGRAEAESASSCRRSSPDCASNAKRSAHKRIRCAIRWRAFARGIPL